MAGSNAAAASMAMVGELEVEMMQDMFKRMTGVCQAKCISPSYREAELSKGESVCLDRCVAKYLEVSSCSSGFYSHLVMLHSLLEITLSNPILLMKPFQVHDKLGKKLTSYSVQDEAQMQKLAQSS